MRLTTVLALPSICLCGGGASAAPSSAYPVEPWTDAPFDVRADGMPVPVERVGQDHVACYARFACPVAATVEIRVNGEGPLQAIVDPARLVDRFDIEDDRIRFAVEGPGPRVVRARRGEQELPPLFVLVQRPETDPPRPGAPGVVDVAAYGAVPSASPQTKPLQRALDACAAVQEGGTVYVGPGTYRSGTLVVHDRTTLYLAPGAVIAAVEDPAAFPVSGGLDESGTLGHSHSNSRLLLFDGAANAALRGRGTLDAMGHVLRNQHNRRVQVIDAHNCANLTIEGVVLKNSASWTLHLLHCDNVRVADVALLGDWGVGNTDGIDPDSSRNVLIENVFAYCGDDAIAIKTTGNSGLLRDSYNITVRDSVVLTRKTALKIGTETRANITNVLFDNIDVVGSSRGAAIWLRDGAEVSRVTFRNLRMDLHEFPGEIRSGQPFYFSHAQREGLGILRDVRVEDVACRAPWCARIEAPAEAPIENLVFDRVAWTVRPRTLKIEPKPLFDVDNHAEVVLRGLAVDWEQADREQWTGVLNEGAMVRLEQEPPAQP